MAASPTRPGGRDSYRRRNLLPAGLIVVVLLVAGIVTWTVVLTGSGSAESTACNPPVRGGGTAVARSALDETPGAPPGDVAVRVLNGAGQRGQAQLAAVELGELGIAEAAQPDNDPLYPNLDLTCEGQIRYGPASASAARTLSLVVPCAELVDDGRAQPVVDLALGSEFRDITPSAATADALRALARGAAAGTPEPDAEPAALTAVRDVECG